MVFGISNSFKRGIVSTYGSTKLLPKELEDDYRPHKRMRLNPAGASGQLSIAKTSTKPSNVEGEEASADSKIDDASEEVVSSSVTEPSSPSQENSAPFSSDPLPESDSELSTPPSSPPQPPLEPIIIGRVSKFSVLKRKRVLRPAGEPLSDIQGNARTVPSAPPKSTKALTQMQIDLGGDVSKSCRTCGMEYVPSLKEDAALHSRFCTVNMQGIELGKAFLKDASVHRIPLSEPNRLDSTEVVCVDRNSSHLAHNKVRAVLELVNTELSAPDIEDSRLWDQAQPEHDRRRNASKATATDPEASKKYDRFKAFLCLSKDRCVGFCLAEKIKTAYSVVESCDMHARKTQIADSVDNSSISIARTADVALLGISRIWTSKNFRQAGVARALMDGARSGFFYGLQVPKTLCAFSQPTESGKRLAEGWFGMKTGWHVYQGDNLSQSLASV